MTDSPRTNAPRRTHAPLRAALAAWAFVLALPAGAVAAVQAETAAIAAPAVEASPTAPSAGPQWAAIGFDQHLDAPLPLQTRLTDDDARPIRLAEALGGRPAVLVFNYYDCPNLCALTLDALFDSLPRLGLRAGQDFDIVAVSIDPREGFAPAARRKADLLRRHAGAADPSGVHFLTGQADQIEPLAARAGLRYAYDARLDQYAHATGLIVVTPDGRIARYLFGARFPAHELRLALVEASEGRIGTLTDRVWLSCFHYDPARGRYSLAILAVLRGLGVACAALLAAGVLVMLARERRERTARRNQP